MMTFEDKLQASAQRLAAQDNRQMHVPRDPLVQKKTYWGWVATPAAAVAGLIFGMSVHLFVNNEPDIRYVYQTDTLRIAQPVHDTLFLTQIVEKEKLVVRPAVDTSQTEPVHMQEETDTPACTSNQCDGINYAILVSN